VANLIRRRPTPAATTKDVGKGTGLGLDIARRIIVERHNGSITITSTPGETTLHVQIPIRQKSTS